MSTDLAVREGATLFAGTTPREVVEAATEAANELHSVIEQRRLSTRIGSSEHVRIEGWQVLGSMVGVFAVKAGGVEALPWPLIPNDGLPGPEDPGREPRRTSPEWPAWKAAADRAAHWEQQQALIRARDRGLAFGFKASFKAEKDGREVGWGEGRCARSESNWADRDDYALASMAQTRAQSKALRQPLGFVVGLAGYATTPAEELGADQPAPAAPPTLDVSALHDLAVDLQKQWPNYDAFMFLAMLNRRFGDDGVPEAAGLALRAWAWWMGRPPESALPTTQEPPEASPTPPEPETEAQA